MIRNLKLGMVLGAILALAAVGASAAQAASSLDVGATPAILTGTQATTNKLLVRANTGGATLTTVKCEKANLKATTTTANVTSASLTPTYENCEFGGLKAIITLNGCTYTLTNTATPLTADADTVCPEGKVIEIEQPSTGCILTVAGGQNNLEHIVFANVAGTPDHVTATLTVSMIVVKGNNKCPANLQGTVEGELTGTQTVKAYEDIGGVEGAQTTLTAT